VNASHYQAVKSLPEIAEALVIGVEQPDGGYWMPLFVVLAFGAERTDELKQRINATIRTQVSPRHVSDGIIAAPGTPHTRTGKKLEIPIKKIFPGADPARAVDNPSLLDWHSAVKMTKPEKP
jgi:acetoacetyl-CoA synthetase